MVIEQNRHDMHRHYPRTRNKRAQYWKNVKKSYKKEDFESSLARDRASLTIGRNKGGWRIIDCTGDSISRAKILMEHHEFVERVIKDLGIERIATWQIEEYDYGENVFPDKEAVPFVNHGPNRLDYCFYSPPVRQTIGFFVENFEMAKTLHERVGDYSEEFMRRFSSQ